MNKIISVRHPDIPYLTDIVVYVVTKSGQYLNASQARALIGRGDVRVNGGVVRECEYIMSIGLNVIEVYGKRFPIDVVPAGKE